MVNVKIKSGYAKHNGKTVDGLLEILKELSHKGYGDYEVCFGFDGDLAYTATDGEYEIEENTIWFKEQEF